MMLPVVAKFTAVLTGWLASTDPNRGDRLRRTMLAYVGLPPREEGWADMRAVLSDGYWAGKELEIEKRSICNMNYMEENPTDLSDTVLQVPLQSPSLRLRYSQDKHRSR